MQSHQYFSHKQSYFCSACKNKSLMASGPLKNNRAERWRAFTYVRARLCVHLDMRAADPRAHQGVHHFIWLLSSMICVQPSLNHFWNSDLTLCVARSMLLIKRKLVFIFKPHHQLRLISRPSLGSTVIPCWNCFLCVWKYQLFKAIFWKCNGFHIVVESIKNARLDLRLQWLGGFETINNKLFLRWLFFLYLNLCTKATPKKDQRECLVQQKFETKKRARTSHIVKKHLQRWKWQRAPTRESHTSVTNARACKISSQLPGFTVISIHWPEWMRVIAGKMAWLSQSKLLSFQPSSRESHWHVNSRQKKRGKKKWERHLRKSHWHVNTNRGRWKRKEERW